MKKKFLIVFNSRLCDTQIGGFPAFVLKKPHQQMKKNNR